MNKLVKPSWMSDIDFESFKKAYDKAPVESVVRTSKDKAKDMASYIKTKRNISR